MPKTTVRSGAENAAIVIFFTLVAASLLSPLWVFRDLLFPFITSKAFFFRICIELALPLYVYLLVLKPSYRPSWRNPLVLSMLAFLLFSFLASLVGVNETRSLWGNFERMGGTYYLAHLMLLAFYVILLAQIGGKYIRNILYVVFGVAVFITLNGVYGWLGGQPLVPDPSLPTRVSSTLGNPIFLGSFLILPMFLAAFFALQEEGKGKKITFWIITALLLVGIVLSVTRGAIVGLVAGFLFSAVVYVWLNANRRVKLYGSIIVVVGFAVIVSFYAFHAHLPQNRLTRLFELQGPDTQSRFLQWKSAWQGFLERPVLGVGPENFYYISNKFYDPNMVKYDPSWFDKPHNYVLEVLSTTGALGFVSYMAMALLVLWALYRAYRAEYLTLLQMCILAAGFVSYFVQNIFVFDTIPASMMFYVFVGFAAYLWMEVVTDRGADKGKMSMPASGIALASLLVGGVVVVYAIFVTNITPLKAAKNTNYGYAYISIDPVKSYDYFEDAAHSSFNFDLQDTGQRFSDLANTIVRTPQLDAAQAKGMVDNIADFEKGVAENIGNDPVSWEKVAQAYFAKSVTDKTAIDPYAEYAIKKSIELAPNRMEPELFLVQLYVAESRLQDAKNELQKINSTIPLVAYSANSRWLEAYVDHLMGKDAEGVALAEQMAANEYAPQTPQIAMWVADYYREHKNFGAVVAWNERLAKQFPHDSSVVFSLAQAYQANGQTQQARDIAQKLVEADAPNKADAQAFLQTLH